MKWPTWLVISMLALSGNARSSLCVQDDMAQQVCLEQEARRIVTLSPHATELVFDAGAGDKLKGTVRFSDYPEQARQIPRLGDVSGLDREAFVIMQPDLIIAWPSGNRPGDLAWLRKTGIPIYYSEPLRLEQIAQSIKSIGRLAGTGDVATIKANDFLARLDRNCRPKQQNRTYIHIWDRPRMTIGGNHWINSVLETAGLTNIFQDINRNNIIISNEAWLSRRADLQLQSDHTDSERPRPGTRIITTDFSRPSTRLADTLELLCAL